MAFRKVRDREFAFYHDGNFIGHITKDPDSRWSVVGRSKNKMYPLSGIYSRNSAAEILLKIEGFIDRWA